MEPIARAQAHQARIDSLWDFDDPDESARRFTDAANSSRGLDGEILTTQVARALGLQGRYDEALALLDTLPDDEDEELRVRVLLERGRVLNSGGDPDRAQARVRGVHSRRPRTPASSSWPIDALHMLAIVAPPRSRTR